MKRAGFTMIELIFVIVILGILAAVAIPKLAATRNDAKIASDMTSVSQALQNLGAEYVASGDITADSLAAATSAAKCFGLTEPADGNVTVTVITVATDDCPTGVMTGVTERAKANGIINSDGTAKTYQFGGTGVTF